MGESEEGVNRIDAHQVYVLMRKGESAYLADDGKIVLFTDRVRAEENAPKFHCIVMSVDDAAIALSPSGQLTEELKQWVQRVKEFAWWYDATHSRQS